MSNLENFVGLDSKNQKEREDYYYELDSFQLKKLDYIKEMYDNEKTALTVWRIYNNNIHEYEVSADKDAMKFDINDIENVLSSKFQYKESYRRTIISFIVNYMEWGVARGDLEVNIAKTIDVNKVTKNKLKIIKENIYGLDEFYSMLDEINIKLPKHYTIPLLLARYGVLGKNAEDICNLKWQDVDLENNEIKIIDYETGELKQVYYTDNRFSKYMSDYKYDEDLNKTIETNYVVYKRKVFETITTDIRYTGSGLRNLTMVIAKTMENDRIAFKDLIQSRKLDYLLALRSTRKITNLDLYATTQLLAYKKETYTTTNLLKSFYESLTDEKIIMTRGVDISRILLEDDNAKEYVMELCDKINFSFPEEIDLKVFEKEEDEES